ncbi:MAG: cytochrome c [Firmicutes bacterium]|nr:cytochrome c [Bacillota bacterium]
MRQIKGKHQKWASVLVLLLLLALTGFVVAGCSGSSTEKSSSEQTEQTGGEAEEGRQLTPQEKAQEGRVKDETNPAVLYTNNCGPCHGGDGGGIVGPAIKGTSLTVEQIQKQIENGTTRDGNVVMPAFKGGELSDEQIKAIANYVKKKLK